MSSLVSLLALVTLLLALVTAISPTLMTSVIIVPLGKDHIFERSIPGLSRRAQLVSRLCAVLAMVVAVLVLWRVGPCWEHIAQLATTLGIVLGAAWATYTWVHQERLRKFKEDPGLEFSFEASQTFLENGHVIVGCTVSIRNTGPLPVFPAAESGRWQIGRLALDEVDRFIHPSHATDLVEIALDQRLRGVRLEPNTTTVFYGCYVAKPGRVYMVRFSLPAKEREWVWSLWRPVYVPPRLSTPSGVCEEATSSGK